MKKNIALIMGGYSNERAISLKSGEMVYNSCSDGQFQIWRVDISKNGWHVLNGELKIEIDKSDFSFTLEGEKVCFDGVFNAIHGHPGENGIITAYFDLIGLPYSCAHTNEMMLTFDKRSCNAVLKSQGFRVPESLIYRRNEKFDSSQIAEKLGFPCFVKPSRSGSSFGVSRVVSLEELDSAIDYALSEDDTVLIEREIRGMEAATGVYNFGETTRALAVTEVYTENTFFDYEAKYEGKSDEITPARIDEKLYKEVETIAVDVFNYLGLKGFARVDFIIEDGIPYLIEVNTIPGLSPESILPKQIAYTGQTTKSFFEQAIANIL